MAINIGDDQKSEVKVCVPPHLPIFPVAKRNKSFHEKENGLTEEEAFHEAGRCLKCKSAPCVTACPLQVNIPGFIAALQGRDLPKAARILLRGNPFPAVCSRICAQESQCESNCIRNRYSKSVSIGALERYVADWMLENPEKTEIIANCVYSGKKIAVVGGGASGLSVAASLVVQGHEVKIFELMNHGDGDVLWEIPEFRLPKKVLVGEISRILSLGVRVECNAPVGQKIAFRQLCAEYDAIFLAHGSGSPISPGILGKYLSGIYSAWDYLVKASTPMGRVGQLNSLKNLGVRRVVVMGGGDTFTDCARVAVRLGSKEVLLVCHLRDSDMPARQKEVEQAKDDGVEVLELLSPVEIMGDERGYVKGLVCQAMRLCERDLTGRRKPVPIDGDLQEIEANLLVYAHGFSPNHMHFSMIAKDDSFLWKNLIIHKDGSTNSPGIFVGGDKIRKQVTAVQAIASGKKAALAIHAFLKAKGEG